MDNVFDVALNERLSLELQKCLLAIFKSKANEVGHLFGEVTAEEAVAWTTNKLQK